VHAPNEDKCDVTKDSFYEEVECVLDQFCKYHTEILLGHFSAKVETEDIFKPTKGDENLHEAGNDNGNRVANFATSEYLVAKSTMFPHSKIHTHTCTSLDGKAHNQFDHVLTDKI
jgi:hypothetical protein